MKKRIEQLLNGKFEYEPARMILTPDRISVHADPDAVVHGSFRFRTSNESKIKGFLYPSSPRILCNPVEFQGVEEEIHYQIDCSGLTYGAVQSGDITISCELGEYTIPWELKIQNQVQEKATDFKDLDDFVLIAKEDFQLAYRCFISKSFRGFLREKEPDYLDLYEGLMISQLSYQSLETFLVASNKKQPLQITLSKENVELSDLKGPVSEIITLTKNTWGFEKIEIESDARFLRPEKKVITTDEFAGSEYDLSLIVDTNLMHAGKNFGRIVLTLPNRILTIEVMAECTKDKEKGRQNHIRKIMIKELESLYVNFRLKKMDRSTWVERSVSVINSYRRAGGEDPFAELYLIQLYFADGKKQKAMKLLESIEKQKKRLQSPQRYGFYLYISTFFYQEISYVDRVEAEIVRMFYRDKTNWVLLWILFYLQESYLNDDNARYEAVAEQFRYGCRSRIMYLEAYQVLKSSPFLMRHLGKFELQLLRFAAKEDILTAEIIRQVASLATHRGAFNQQLFEVLVAGYNMYPSADIVKAICVLLMQGEKKDSRYFEWYAKGVEQNLRLTGLYEYYMETMPEPDLLKMPQVIRMYFAYDNSLDYRKRAAIYRSIIENREKDPQTFHNYRVNIEKFALDQLEASRISEDLAVIYGRFIRKNALTRHTAEKLARVLCTYEVTCQNPKIRKVIVHSARFRQEQAVQFQNGRALIECYDTDSVFMIEDEEGYRYCADALCSIKKLFDSEDMFVWCVEKAGSFPGVVVYFCLQCLKEEMLNYRTLPFFIAACETKELSDHFLTQLRQEVMQYYMTHLNDDTLPDFLDQISYLDYVKVNKTALITLLAEDGRCADAFALLDKYGSEGIPLLQLVKICSRMVLEMEFAENTMLIAMCHYCFSSGKYDDKLLRYLLLYYEGPIREMKQIWQAATQFELDTMIIEEKLMMLILFTRSETEGTEPIFESYLHKMGRRKFCDAYINLKAYEYFVKGLPVGDAVFQYIERQYEYLKTHNKVEEQEKVCRLALLQYYSNLIELSTVRRENAAALLEEFGASGLRFGFWKRFDEELLAPYQMDGKVFVEYVCDPDSQVKIYYRIKSQSEEYTEVSVQNYFEGIFVREFTLFYGEELECYLKEEHEGNVKQTDKRILRASGSSEGGASRYELLNKISRAQQSGNAQALKEELENYLTLEHLTKEVFTLV